MNLPPTKRARRGAPAPAHPEALAADSSIPRTTDRIPTGNPRLLTAIPVAPIYSTLSPGASLWAADPFAYDFPASLPTEWETSAPQYTTDAPSVPLQNWDPVAGSTQPAADSSNIEELPNLDNGGATDFWTDTALFSLPRWPQTITEDDASRKRKRVRDIAQLDDDDGDDHPNATNANVQWMRDEFPMLFPSTPSMDERLPNGVANPFLEDHEEKYKTLDIRKKPQLPENGVVNGYIKIQFSRLSDDHLYNTPSLFSRQAISMRSQNMWLEGDRSLEDLEIPTLPPNFATGLKMDAVDRKLWTFHLHAYCPGRMVLDENYWCDDLIPMAVSNEGTRHALLCFTTGYALDYEPTEEMRRRANHHYQCAVQHIGRSLNKEDTYKVGGGAAIIAAMIMIYSADIINWETRRPKEQTPLWLQGAHAARGILDRTDPGYRYWDPANVQSTVAHRAQANWVAYTCILAQPVAALPQDPDALQEGAFKWLLEGTREEIHRIEGITGVCPKLLHIFSQITHLAARLVQNPDCEAVVRLAARRLANRLATFWQWSTLSEGHRTYEEIMASWKLGEDGTVTDPAAVTELTAYAWVPAADIYLHCRLYRKPRSHPDVLRSLDRLATCIKRLPCSGPFFTSQSPFFPVFLMAMVAQLPRHRRIAKYWFETVLEGAQCRSSVPPVWTAIKQSWARMDREEDDEDLFDDSSPLKDREPWWEGVVKAMVKEHGVLSLV